MNTKIDRKQLIQDYVDLVVDNMDTKTLMQIVAEQIEENLQFYSDAELIAEVNEYYPELLENN